MLPSVLHDDYYYLNTLRGDNLIPGLLIPLNNSVIHQIAIIEFFLANSDSLPFLSLIDPSGIIFEYLIRLRSIVQGNHAI